MYYDLTERFEVGQGVTYYDDSFDAINPYIPCVVKQVSSASMIITDIQTNTDLYIEEDFGLDKVIPF